MKKLYIRPITNEFVLVHDSNGHFTSFAGEAAKVMLMILKYC
jgi:hypothetical protein